MQIFEAHAQFKSVWTQAKADVVGYAKLGTPEYYAANSHAYSVAAPETEKVNELLNELFCGELGEVEKKFLRGDFAAINTIIDFLELEIPAFRCGYSKEWYLRKMKRLPLSAQHASRLKSLALAMCRSASFRREFKEITRLMIILADPELIADLQAIRQSPSERVRLKSTRMLERILGNRLDLRSCLRLDSDLHASAKLRTTHLG